MTAFCALVINLLLWVAAFGLATEENKDNSWAIAYVFIWLCVAFTLSSYGLMVMLARLV